MDQVLNTVKGNITIRPALPEEAALLRELRLEALASHPEAFGSDYESAATESIASWADRIAQYASENRGVIYVAALQDQLLGMAGLYHDQRLKTGHQGNIWGVYVKADWRGLRLADSLIAACAAWAQRQGLIMLKLGVGTINIPAIRCYVRCGFTIYGIDPKAIYHNDVYYDEFLMVKSI